MGRSVPQMPRSNWFGLLRADRSPGSLVSDWFAWAARRNARGRRRGRKPLSSWADRFQESTRSGISPQIGRCNCPESLLRTKFVRCPVGRSLVRTLSVQSTLIHQYSAPGPSDGTRSVPSTVGRFRSSRVSALSRHCWPRNARVMHRRIRSQRDSFLRYRLVEDMVSVSYTHLTLPTIYSE